jgi:hypothetical protein
VRLVVRLSVLIAMSLGLFNLAAVAVGHEQSINPVMAGFSEGCQHIPQPCWYGMIPGTTTLSEASSQMTALGYRIGMGSSDRSLSYRSERRLPGCVEIFFDSKDTRVNAIILACAVISMGDITAVMGEPLYRDWYGEQDEDGIYGRVKVRLARGWSTSFFDKSQYVSLMRTMTVRESTVPWRGFLPRWKYCQLEPSYKGCRT